ncbi:tRNA (adenosine(37)-N6)-threonylcarbamoyltransferase complex dimerization subunit type 1 TsaB [Mycoplasmopsis columbinasalis]|uniref:Molecular chaperone n=1 Tax=Mycoplasmopsis columbinasalis TaxID=114880 RepID=A0A449B9M1_9BACT|nr:tRNA (adenosine(37)-N6)-threonylcarbamoyltransferase complex dimerization subunit type 1 TsaB [Mycoplasmopsis columbinasalis]VEU77869.1 molecular chaperone [Mycoplasmopsis columbinasalis]
MKIYADTANEDFALILFDENNNCIKQTIIVNAPKKVHLLVDEFNKLVNETNTKISEILEFYLNLGPGYFTGVRTALTFLRTMATILKKPMFTISTFEILQHQNPQKKNFYLNASGNKMYQFCNENVFDAQNIKVVAHDNEMQTDKVDWLHFCSHFSAYQKLFKKYNYQDLIKIEPYYIKKPQIGAQKSIKD